MTRAEWIAKVRFTLLGWCHRHRTCDGCPLSGRGTEYNRCDLLELLGDYFRISYPDPETIERPRTWLVWMLLVVVVLGFIWIPF
jgi:hypothetical protein